MILADTSIWIDYLRRGGATFGEMLLAGKIVCHPFVVGEIACGNLPRRRETLHRFDRLPTVVNASVDEVRTLVERGLFGRGIGYVDIHLLASTLLTPSTRLWTRDKCLRKAATELDVSYLPTTLH